MTMKNSSRASKFQRFLGGFGGARGVAFVAQHRFSERRMFFSSSTTRTGGSGTFICADVHNALRRED